MASTMGFSVLFALVLVTAVAALEAPFGEEKTYGPPYGEPPSGVSPVVPTPDVPYAPPYAPSDPSPTTPYTPDPTTPAPATTGTCTWWSSHPSKFPDLISILATLFDLFGTIASGGTSDSTGATSAISSIFGRQMTVMQGLTNTRNDGYGALARQSSAALLNSLTRRDYPYNAFQVKLQFRNSLHSQQQAFATARLFENANIALGAVRH